MVTSLGSTIIYITMSPHTHIPYSHTRPHTHTHTTVYTHTRPPYTHTHVHHTHTHTHPIYIHLTIHTRAGARAAAVQAALARHPEEDAPMASRRSYHVDPVISPSTSFEENGVASRQPTPQYPPQQVGGWSCDRLFTLLSVCTSLEVESVISY